ncbi:MAG: DUF3320 domain-containing protein [Methanobacteriaceae archaeon]|jgi:superfamily I DNA and/or RNA helicase|nr:DUF3320 domain-containing protein [Candidatus Methanorudis spinitermitis]
MEKSSSNNIANEFENLRKKLLDLTLRNQLLNFKPRAKTIEVANQSPSSIYHTLVLQKQKMQFVPNKKEKDDDEKQKNKSRFSSLWDHPPIDLSIFKEGDKSLKTNFSPKELQKRLFYINQQAKTMVQEQGYNILYLAIGFLEWRTNYKPKEVNLAPLILIPVDIQRKKVGKSFSISWNGEELQSNISLQAKLLEDGIKLPDFKQTPYIEGIEHYLKDVKNAVSRMKDWKVLNYISLGFFSFTKFVMYNDLNPESWEDNVDLTKHELIEAIFNPSKNKYNESFNEDEIDNKLLYENTYHVLDADSSQIAAIEDVKAGINLVVEGPPGTGKSQTIVNLIAELLASGKSILFVSEKMAALEVVKNRLDNVGLGKFTLELHSHKTRRKKFLKELEKALNTRSIDDMNMDQIFRKLESLKIQLDNYADIIHEKMYKVELSPFQLYGLKESADDYFSKKNLLMPLAKIESAENITLKNLDDMVIELENLAEIYNTIAKKNPWNYCNPKSLLPSDLREIELLINDTLATLDEFNQESIHLYDNYGIKISHDLRSYEKSLEGLKLLDKKKIEIIDGEVLTNKQWTTNSRKAYNLIEKLEVYQSLSKNMEKFNDIILNEDLNFLINEITKSTNKKFKLFGGNSYKELVNPFYKTKVPNDKTVLKDLKQIKNFIQQKKSLKNEEKLAEGFFGELWHLNASITDLKNLANWMKSFNNFLKDEIYSKKTIEVLSQELFDVNIQYEIKNYINSGDKFRNTLKKLESKLNPRSKLIFKKETDDVPFDKWKKQLNTWKGQLSSLHLWSQYLNTKNVCLKSHSSLFIKSIEKKNIKKEDVKFLVFGNFADSLLNLIFTENETLATFIGELHEDRILEFKQLDSKIVQLNRKRIFQQLSKKLPKVFGATEDEEAKVLAGEFTRKRGHLPVRKLLEKAGGLIKQIKPCFMMSPLSIAQYLDPTNLKLQFDVVIFDEASQVKPEDALGAFMRAKTAVVMGDTQQLPPTSFFDQIVTGESEEEVATALDMESILHLCKLSFPVRMLKWHYRSRHESLIAVSNKEFYDNQLLVYPSPSHNTDSLGLKFKYNRDTYYDRGKSAVNREEAKEVVKEIFKHFNKYGETKSLGVGTFSVSQMNAILEELEIERRQHPELEPLFSDKRNERFFVKNLETIQGDERDVIIISVGYGFDKENKISLNFGPLNQDGGERRLNVLITRAREKCIVFSNFKSSDMHLSSNPPFGVKALKEFLEFAENISSGHTQKVEKEDEPFEDAIYNFLIESGYKVDKQVGYAGFRVDLAIIDDENPGRYILGIECDGKMYASSKVARDRDRLREQVLTGLGWKLYHLWSTDWYRNRDLAREKLLDYIKKIKSESFIEDAKEFKNHTSIEDEGLKIVDPIIDDDLDIDSLANEKIQTNTENSKVNENNDFNDDDIILDSNPLPDTTIIESKIHSEKSHNKNLENNENMDCESTFEDNNKINQNNFNNYRHDDFESLNKENNLNNSENNDLKSINDDNHNFNNLDHSHKHYENLNFKDETNVKKPKNNHGIKFRSRLNVDFDDNSDEYSNGMGNTDNNLTEDEISNDNEFKLENNNYNEENSHDNELNDNIEANDDFKSNSDFGKINSYEPSLQQKTQKQNTDKINSYEPSLQQDEILKNDSNSDLKDETNNHETFEEKIYMVNESISEIKSEMKNISDSINEIENKKVPKNIFIINKTKNNEIATENDLYTSNLAIDNELNNDELENIIQNINEKYHDKNDFLKVEKNNNMSKEKDIEDYLIDYTTASDLPIKDSKELYNNSIKNLSTIVDEIVFIEGPIHVNEVIVRIRESCNIKRAGSKIKQIISQAIAASEHNGSIINIDDFLFQNNWSNIPIRKRKQPNINLIANEEIEENIKLILNFNETINQSELVKIAAKNFGFKATSQKTADKINAIIEYMIINGDIINTDGKIKFFKE